MKNYSFGTPLSIRWHFAKPDGTPFDLGGFSYRLKYRCGRGTGYAQSTLLPSLGNVLVWTFPAEEQRFTGIYDLELTLFEGGRKHSVCKYVGAFSLEKKLPEAQVVHEIVSGINQTPAESLDGPAAVIDATLNDLEYTDETVPEIVDLFTAAEWFACSYVMPMAGSDGYWRYNGEVIRDDKGTPVRWKPNIVVTDEVPALGDTEEGVIYRIMDGQEFTDYAMVDGDIVSVDSGRLLDLEAKVNNLKAEDVAYNGSLPASTVKEALDNVARNKASQSQVDTMMTTKADKSQVATLNQDVAQMGYDLTQKASKAKVEDLEETVTSHGERLCTIDDVLGTKATVGELANVNSAVAVNAQGIVDVNERIDSLKAQDIFYKGGGTVQTAIDKVRTNKQDKLVSGENIKTINGQPILGSGNIEIQGGGSKVIEIPILNSNSTQEEIAAVADVLLNHRDATIIVVSELERRLVTDIQIFEVQSFYVLYYNYLDNNDLATYAWIQYFGTYQCGSSSLRGMIPSISGLQKETYRQNVITNSTTNYPSSKGVIDYVSGVRTSIMQDVSGFLDLKENKKSILPLPTGGFQLWALNPDCYNVCDTPLTSDDEITIFPIGGRQQEHTLRFSVAEGATPTLTWANNITAWVGGAPTIEGGKTYLVSIQDGIGIIVEV